MNFKNDQLVTPTTAKEMMKRMGRNRKINQSRLDYIKSDLKNGRFTQCANPICFDTEGTLIDGQHRLTAIIETGIPAVLNIAYNVPYDSVIDRGIERSTGDGLYMRGKISREMSSSKVISIVKRYLTIMTGSSHGFTPDDIGDFINMNDDTLRKALFIVPHKGVANIAPFRTAIFAALLNGIEENILKDFSYVVCDGYANGMEESAAITLRNYLLEFKQGGGHMANKIEAYSEQAIRDFSKGVPRKRKYTKEDHIYIPHRTIHEWRQV